MSDLSEAMVTAGAKEIATHWEVKTPSVSHTLEARAAIAAALRVLADRGYTLEEDGASIWSVVYPRQLADAVEHPAEDGTP